MKFFFGVFLINLLSDVAMKNAIEEITEDQWKDIIDIFRNPTKIVEIDLSKCTDERIEEIKKIVKDKFKEKIDINVKSDEKSKLYEIKFHLDDCKYLTFKVLYNIVCCMCVKKINILDSKVKNPFEEIPKEKWEEVLSIFHTQDKTVEINLTKCGVEKFNEIKAFIKEKFNDKVHISLKLDETKIYLKLYNDVGKYHMYMSQF